MKGRALEDGLEDAVAERGQEQYYYPPPQSPGYDGRSKSPVTSPRAFHLPFRQEQDQYLSKANEKDEDVCAQPPVCIGTHHLRSRMRKIVTSMPMIRLSVRPSSEAPRTDLGIQAAHPRHDGKTEPLSVRRSVVH